jgi:hypothetical protein
MQPRMHRGRPHAALQGTQKWKDGREDRMVESTARGRVPKTGVISFR